MKERPLSSSAISYVDKVYEDLCYRFTLALCSSMSKIMQSSLIMCTAII